MIMELSSNKLNISSIEIFQSGSAKSSKNLFFTNFQNKILAYDRYICSRRIYRRKSRTISLYYFISLFRVCLNFYKKVLCKTCFLLLLRLLAFSLLHSLAQSPFLPAQHGHKRKIIKYLLVKVFLTSFNNTKHPLAFPASNGNDHKTSGF